MTSRWASPSSSVVLLTPIWSPSTLSSLSTSRLLLGWKGGDHLAAWARRGVLGLSASFHPNPILQSSEYFILQISIPFWWAMFWLAFFLLTPLTSSADSYILAFFILLGKSAIFIHPLSILQRFYFVCPYLFSVSLCFINPYLLYSFAVIFVDLRERAKTSMHIQCDVQTVVKLHLWNKLFIVGLGLEKGLENIQRVLIYPMPRFSPYN